MRTEAPRPLQPAAIAPPPRPGEKAPSTHSVELHNHREQKSPREQQTLVKLSAFDGL